MENTEKTKNKEKSRSTSTFAIVFFAVAVSTLIITIFYTGISIGQKHYVEKGTPLYISDLEKWKIYVRPDKHDNIVLFVDGINDRVAYLPEDCPKRFYVIDNNGTLRVIPVPSMTP